ncbi:MAG: hypothetical protein U0Y08_11190 [Bacteroidia bacterium]
MKKTILPILAAAAWISISEFARNQFWLHTYWTEHYSKMGLQFPAEPTNGAIWGIWSLCMAVFIFILAKKYSLFQTTILGWYAGFILMWLVIGNLGVLPIQILMYAAPISFLEVLIATWIIKELTGNSASN